MKSKETQNKGWVLPLVEREDNAKEEGKKDKQTPPRVSLMWTSMQA